MRKKVIFDRGNKIEIFFLEKSQTCLEIEEHMVYAPFVQEYIRALDVFLEDFSEDGAYGFSEIDVYGGVQETYIRI